jgi:hypothetical protein
VKTGKIVESYNPHSRFVLKEGEGHGDMRKYWLENLQYVVQLVKEEGHELQKASQMP